MTALAGKPTRAPKQSAELFGHPRGLVYIVFTEAWERFSFYGMQALLVLYMTGYLLHPGTIENVAGFTMFRWLVETVFGPLTTQALATQIFGIYGGLVYLMPVFGGLLGDRVLGRTLSVSLGAGVMVLGHFLMAFEFAFLIALLCIVLGCGLLKGNLAAQVGMLYKPEDQRRDRAFSIYYVGVNLGAFIAPLICGTLGEVYGWHYGFGAAGVGMTLGLIAYLAGRHHLPAEPKTTGEDRATLQPGDGRAIFGLLAMLVILTLFWTAQTQVWNTYPLWVRDNVDRGLMGLTVPITWFQSIDALAVLLLAPAIMFLWRKQATRNIEPGDLGKLMTGCFLFAAACLTLALGQFLAGSGRVAIIWPIAFHFICASGYLFVVPIGLALFARVAPASINALMMSVFYIAIFFGSIASGWMGRFYEVVPSATFWLMHAAIVASGGLAILLLGRPLGRAMRL
ncbi:peptide MFS transporter [Altericroceibacterium endophyticum]|uniref:MFS transporter n=1 Tax=Altericroceibacterium endophyticum TaxID=1808508 RepID=A0A6I4T962_9SPHN|nr:peptide MFS transporter [Altericroceibacterium endophyticum]MXO66681.1 MFS transporter [Altericroceibacterium endophyticum]